MVICFGEALRSLDWKQGQTSAMAFRGVFIPVCRGDLVSGLAISEESSKIRSQITSTVLGRRNLMSDDIAARIRPVAEPQIIENAYTPDQHQRMVQAVRQMGPLKTILSQHFASPEEVIATMSGAMPEGVTPTFDMFLTPNFRGYFARFGTCLIPELEDCFYNSRFLALARSYWNAEYAKPENMLFNINGPCHSTDPAHLDATEFRGINQGNSPIWLMNTMAKSGLFNRWIMKKAQVIAWYYKGNIGGGFTYWPEGPHAQPKRIAAPMWGRAVVVQNEMMYHRGEPNGPIDQRKPEGLAFDSVFEADPEVADGWRIRTGEAVIQKVPAEEMRFLVHWGAAVYADFAELKAVMDHSDDLTHDQVFDTFIKDMRQRGLTFDVPSDPLRDRAFITLLNKTYDPGVPRLYPAEAPGPHQLAA